MNKNENIPDNNGDKARYSEDLSRAAVQRLFDDDEADASPPEESEFVKGFDRNPTKRPDQPKAEDNPAPKEEPAEEPARSSRRDSATNRILHGDAPEETPERPGRERPRRRNPVPKPAVRVNVPQERPVRERQGQKPPEQPDEHSSPEELDSFRRRYNSEELFSPPRNPNRPVRPGKADVRTNRMKSDYAEEPISPIRIILMCGAIFILVIVAFLVWQLLSTRSDLREAEQELYEARSAVTAAEAEAERQIREMRAQRDAAEELRDDYLARLREHGIDPYAPPDLPDDVTAPHDIDGPTPPPTPGARPELPTTHTVVHGDRLVNIAYRYFGNRYPATVNHIVSANNLRDPDHIWIGQVLQITPMN